MRASSNLALVAVAGAVVVAACGGVVVVPASTGGGSTTGSAPDAGTGGGSCAAPLSQCGASCADLTSDASHCGSCGHGCQGGACAASVCQPLTMVTTNGYAYGVAVDATHVYWTETDSNLVLKVPVGGGAPIQMAIGNTPTSIAVSATDVYWTDNFSGKVMTIPKSGGTAVALVTGQAQPGNIALHDASVYWLNTGQYTEVSAVLSAPLAGGPPITLATGGPLFGLGAGDVAVDGANVYWASNIGVQAVPLGGGAPLVFAPGAAVTVDDTSVYTCSSDAGVQRVPKGGGPAVTLASGGAAQCAGPIVVDATRAYWLAPYLGATSAASLMSVSLSGGPVTTLASLDEATFVDLALDATSVYWTSGGAVMKVAKP